LLQAAPAKNVTTRRYFGADGRMIGLLVWFKANAAFFVVWFMANATFFVVEVVGVYASEVGF
jgi:hypothetical protein